MKKRIFIFTFFLITSFSLNLTAQFNVVEYPPISDIKVVSGAISGCGLVNRRTGEVIMPINKEYRIRADYETRMPTEYHGNLIKVEYTGSYGGGTGEGYINTLGQKTAIGFKYALVGPIINGKIVVSTLNPNSRSGLVDLNGKVILPIEFTKIENCESYSQYYAASKVISSKTSDNKTIRNELVAIYDSNGKQILPFKYHYVAALGPNLFLVSKEPNKLGIKNEMGVVDSLDNVIVAFTNELRLVCDKVQDRVILMKVNSSNVESFIVLKEDGTEVKDQLTASLQKLYSQGGYLKKRDYIIQDDHYEMYDGTNRGIVQVSESGALIQKIPQADQDFSFYRNIFIKSGKIITDLNYNVVYNLESISNPDMHRLFLPDEEFILIYPKGIYNREGKLVYSLDKKTGFLYSDVFAIANYKKTPTVYEFISMRAPEKSVLGLDFKRVAPGLLVIAKMKGKIKKYAFFDNNLNQLSDFIYEDVLYAMDNRLSVKKDGKMGVLDLKLNEVTPITYRRVYGFYNGIAGYESENGCGWIDTTGKAVRFLSESYPEKEFVDNRVEGTSVSVILTGVRNGKDSVLALNPITKRFEKSYNVKITEHVSTCKKCAGKGKAIIKTGNQCNSCYGTGGNAKNCVSCGGRGSINKVQSVNAITYSSTNLVQTVTSSSASKCYTCNGVGKYGYCHSCNGVGYTNVREVEGECDQCNGKGETVERFKSTLSDH